MSAQIKAQDIKDDKESKKNKQTSKWKTWQKKGSKGQRAILKQFLLSEDLSQDMKTGHKKMKQTED